MVLAVFATLVAVGVWLMRQRPGGSDGTALRQAETPDDEPRDVGVIPIEDVIDLHGFQPRDILGVVDSYLEAAAKAGLGDVRLIHGRGKGVQRRNVQALLANHPLVDSYGDAPAHLGGWGATIVRLKQPPAS